MYFSLSYVYTEINFQHTLLNECCVANLEECWLIHEDALLIAPVDCLLFDSLIDIKALFPTRF